MRGNKRRRAGRSLRADRDLLRAGARWRAAFVPMKRRARNPRRRTPGSACRLSPDFPRRLSAVPQLIKKVQIAIRGHALPEARVRIDRQLTLVGESLHRCFFEDTARVFAQIVEHARFEYKKSAVDEAFLHLRFLAELRDFVAL